MPATPRRKFLRQAALIMAAGAAARHSPSVPAADGPAAIRIVDTNVHLGRWPFRRLPLDETARLVAKLRTLGVQQAWAGTFDGLLHEDIAAVNARLAEDCRASGGMLVPFGEINPALPGWEDELHRCHETHRMPGLRLHPNYHGYTLNDPRFARLLALAAERGLLLQIVVMMEDERTQHPLARVPHVDVNLLPELLGKAPRARVQLLNAFRSVRGQILLKLAATGRVFFELASLEGAGGVAALLKQVPLDRVLFGSHAPFFYPESAHVKLLESDLSLEQRAAVTEHNAVRVLKSPVP
jgi:uncharacterized protein